MSSLAASGKRIETPNKCGGVEMDKSSVAGVDGVECFLAAALLKNASH
ncbi:hypothetical protein [Halomonas sp. G11]|nr:hypothetical protein [Halomonas sp. G11]